MDQYILCIGYLFTTYDIFIINVVVDIMANIYDLTDFNNTVLKFSVLCGVIIGHLIFGMLSDKIGRRYTYMITSCIIILSNILSVCAQDTKYGIFVWLTITRFLLGVGVGGDSPLSAVLTSESVNNNNNIETLIKNLCITCSMKGFGELMSSIVLVVITQTIDNPEVQWRLALGFSILPMIVILYFRTGIKETRLFSEIKKNRYDKISYNSIDDDGDDIINLGYESESFTDIIISNSHLLFGITVISFISGYIFYANGLFSGIITRFMGVSNDSKSEALHVFLLQVISFPGYLLSIFYLNQIGCKNMLIFGFLMSAIIYLIIACFHPILKQVEWLYIIMYGLSFFFQNFGPDTAIYVLRTIIFPTIHRTTCNGIVSAFGKLGAISGIIVFYFLKNIFCKYDCSTDYDNKPLENGFRLVFGVCAFFSLIGCLWSKYFVIDTVDRSLIEIQTVVDNDIVRGNRRYE